MLNVGVRIFDRIGTSYIVKHLEENQLMDKCNYGGIKLHNTLTCPKDLEMEIAQRLATNPGNMLISVSIDISRFFDSIPARQMLQMMHKNNIRGDFLFQYFKLLTSRIEYVEQQGYKSKINEVKKFYITRWVFFRCDGIIVLE